MTKVNQQGLIELLIQCSREYEASLSLGGHFVEAAEGRLDEALQSLLVENERAMALVKRAYDFANQTMRVDFTDRQNYVAAEILAGDCRTLLGDS